VLLPGATEEPVWGWGNGREEKGVEKETAGVLFRLRFQQLRRRSISRNRNRLGDWFGCGYAAL